MILLVTAFAPGILRLSVFHCAMCTLSEVPNASVVPKADISIVWLSHAVGSLCILAHAHMDLNSLFMIGRLLLSLGCEHRRLHWCYHIESQRRYNWSTSSRCATDPVGFQSVNIGRRPDLYMGNEAFKNKFLYYGPLRIPL